MAYLGLGVDPYPSAPAAFTSSLGQALGQIGNQQQNFAFQLAQIQQQKQAHADQVNALHFDLLLKAAEMSPDLARPYAKAIVDMRERMGLPTSQAFTDFITKLKPEDAEFLNGPAIQRLRSNPTRTLTSSDPEVIGALGDAGLQVTRGRTAKAAQEEAGPQLQPPPAPGPIAPPIPSPLGPAAAAPPAVRPPGLGQAASVAQSPRFIPLTRGGGGPSLAAGGAEAPQPQPAPTTQPVGIGLAKIDEQMANVNRAMLEVSTSAPQNRFDQARQANTLQALQRMYEALKTQREDYMKETVYAPGAIGHRPATGEFIDPFAAQRQVGGAAGAAFQTQYVPGVGRATLVPDLTTGIPKWQIERFSPEERAQEAVIRNHQAKGEPGWDVRDEASWIKARAEVKESDPGYIQRTNQLAITNQRAEKLLNFADVRVSAEQRKEYVLPLIQQNVVLNDLSLMDKRLDKLEAKGLLPGPNATKLGMTAKTLWRNWATPTDPDLRAVKAFYNEVMVGEVARGLFNERGNLQRLAFSNTIDQIQEMPSRQAWTQILGILRDSLADKSRQYRELAKNDPLLRPGVQAQIDAASRELERQSQILGSGEAPATPPPPPSGFTR